MTDPIKHVWFDLDGTLTIHTPEFNKAHNQLLHTTYAKATNRQLTPDIATEYDDEFKQKGSNSAVFRSLGLPTDYWMKHFNTMDKDKYYRPIPEIQNTLEKLKTIVPISLFTNDSAVGTAKTIQIIDIKENWFTHIITGDDVSERKPQLEGFHLMVAKSQIPAGQILYVGDRVSADIEPAKLVGVQTCLLYSQSPRADYSFDAFSDLLTLFRTV